MLSPCRRVEHPTPHETPEGVSRDGWAEVALDVRVCPDDVRHPIKVNTG
ncbi:hypothetical protein AB0M48_08540 [Lentzea sp. NPDC051208]